MWDNQGMNIKIAIEGDPESVANFFRAVSFHPAITCVAGDCWDPDKIPGNRAIMEFERSKVLREGNPNLFERK